MLLFCVYVLMKASMIYGDSSPCDGADAGLVAHPTECHQYFDCSSPGVVLECVYPDLFDGHKCTDFTEMTCGDKHEPIDGCDYMAQNDPRGGRGPPCYIYYPSCKDLQDGKNSIPYIPSNQPTPYYMNCYKGRNMDKGERVKCPLDNSNHQMLFDGATNTCRKASEFMIVN